MWRDYLHAMFFLLLRRQVSNRIHNPRHCTASCNDGDFSWLSYLPFQQFLARLRAIFSMSFSRSAIRLFLECRLNQKVSRFRSTGGAALEQQDLAAVSAPALGKHTVGGKFRTGCHRSPDAAAIARKGNQRKYLTEAVLIEIVFGKSPLKALLNNPVTVIQGQALGHLDNAQSIYQ